MGWEHIRSTYDVVADKYEDRFVDELEHKPRDRELLEAFAASVADPVVDVGCGPGQIGAFLRHRNRRVIGADLSAQMARRASARLDGAIAADMRTLPFATEALGGVVAFYSLIHLRRAELPPVLHEFRRVVRPGGRVLFSAHEGQGDVELNEFLGESVPLAATFFALDELIAACEAAGLVVDLAERREPYRTESTVRLYVEATRSQQ